MDIEIDFDVYKALTVMRRYEDHSFNEVLREVLSLPSSVESIFSGAVIEPMPFQSRDLVLPQGTQLRATYKGKTYTGRIDQGQWLDENGNRHTSPSAAANAVTGTTVNGLRFWQAKRPGDTGWLNLDVLQLLR